MSTTESASRRKRTTESTKSTPEDDHRRKCYAKKLVDSYGQLTQPEGKRRNRTTQSCLNCHTSKRMVMLIFTAST